MTELIVDAADPIALIGGAQLGPQHLNILQTLSNLFVAADGGADQLLAAGIDPVAVIGDFDSLTDTARSAFSPQLYHVAEQDTTDLEKSLDRISAPAIVGAGFLGGRLDHSFAALNALARRGDTPMILLSESECCFRAPNRRWQIDLPVGTPFAILPMHDVVASSTGLEWDMDQMALSPIGRVSSSNRTAQERVEVTITGAAIVTLPLDQLAAAIGVVRVG